jgi:hypothetical protein
MTDTKRWAKSRHSPGDLSPIGESPPVSQPHRISERLDREAVNGQDKPSVKSDGRNMVGGSNQIEITPDRSPDRSRDRWAEQTLKAAQVQEREDRRGEKERNRRRRRSASSSSRSDGSSDSSSDSSSRGSEDSSSSNSSSDSDDSSSSEKRKRKKKSKHKKHEGRKKGSSRKDDHKSKKSKEIKKKEKHKKHERHRERTREDGGERTDAAQRPSRNKSDPLPANLDHGRRRNGGPSGAKRPAPAAAVLNAAAKKMQRCRHWRAAALPFKKQNNSTIHNNRKQYKHFFSFCNTKQAFLHLLEFRIIGSVGGVGGGP